MGDRPNTSVEVGQVYRDDKLDRWLLVTYTRYWTGCSRTKPEWRVGLHRVQPADGGRLSDGWKWSIHGPAVKGWATDHLRGRSRIEMREKQLLKYRLVDNGALYEEVSDD